MKTRMEKYYRDDLSEMKRSKKNQQLYQDVYGKYSDLDNLDVPMNTNEIDLSQLKTMINSRDDYRKAKEYEQISNKHIVPAEQPQERYIEEKQRKIYDINELLEQAKSSRPKEEITNTSTINYLEALRMEAEIIQKNKPVEEFVPPKEEEEFSTKSLPLEILSDLKPDDNTVVSAPIVEKTQSLEVKEELKKIQDDNDAVFYSGSYKFSKSDFVDGDDFAPSKKGIFFKVLLLLIFLIALGVGIFYVIVNYVL